MPSRPTSALRVIADPALADLVDAGKLRPSVPVEVAAAAMSMDESWIRKRLGKELEGHYAGRSVRVYLDSIAAYQAAHTIGEQAPKPARRQKAKPAPRVEHARHREAVAALMEAGLLPQDSRPQQGRGRR